MPNKYLFYISQNYSFEILRPLQEAIRVRGDECAWFVEGSHVNQEYFHDNEVRLNTITDAIKYNPQAVFVPGNVVPNFIPGIKVQVFHGLEWKKKGHFRIRGYFDLYCTHGEITTSRFNQLACQHGYFHVAETGWPKLDPLFQVPPFELDTQLPVVLFAPTFSPNLTCAVACFEEIKKLVDTGEYYWLVKFHPKMAPEWIELYRSIKADNYQIVDTDSALPLLKRADILLSDTSSMIGEFLLLDKFAVTYKNADPGDYLIDVQTPEALKDALARARTAPADLFKRIKANNQRLHPYCDGQSSNRVLDAVNQLCEKPAKLRKKKPLNLLRTIELRKKLSYWKL
ncbi:CDP-glycerol glycerophosphotransferase family protein [Aliikangiella coralliicola]|uniref:CDP-glycerol--glycerophosphate glycerophosphotransferase n=1 Tax=Aliikangiella coralliicola TaxID=2592383 RepID=A0A545TW24_9GAMM|nr:CDP-glycerol glycerophosphotransferase family protein [Aliikangiella coralliicola]TQV81427.1 CDP-glycerol--glycerophosphate glycerophosphotransferase [Aliikangiella coralliicola]